MKIKKAISFIAAVAIICGSVPFYQGTDLHKSVSLTAIAADYTDVTEGDITYHVYSDHVAVAKCDTASISAKISDTIEDKPVTVIEKQAFLECADLVSVTLPNSLTEIGESAFQKCGSLSAVNLPDTVTSIGNFAFADCNALTKFTFPSGTTVISVGVLENCTSLVSIGIPDTVATIEERAFRNCSALPSITVPEGVTTINGDYTVMKYFN